MKKLLTFLLAFLLISPAISEESVPDFLQEKLGIDVRTADAKTLKAVVEGIDISIRPYSQSIEYCLSLLETKGESQWAAQYRDKYPDQLSGMTYSDLVMLKDLVNLAMWESEEWQEVTVPHGLWVVGKDIPVGTWTVKCADTGRNSYLLKYCDLEWGDTIDANGQGIAWSRRYDSVNIYNQFNDDYKGEMTEYTVTVREGDYIYIDPLYNKAVFTPYAGKPSLGFK